MTEHEARLPIQGKTIEQITADLKSATPLPPRWQWIKRRRVRAAMAMWVNQAYEEYLGVLEGELSE